MIQNPNFKKYSILLLIVLILCGGIKYILNGDKTEEQILTAHLNCDPGRECRQMLDTKRAYGKTDRVAYRRTDTPLHIIQPTAFIGAGNCQPQGKRKAHKRRKSACRLIFGAAGGIRTHV